MMFGLKALEGNSKWVVFIIVCGLSLVWIEEKIS